MKMRGMGAALVLGVGLAVLPACSGEKPAAAAGDQAAGTTAAKPMVKGGDDRSGEYEPVLGWWKAAPNHDKEWHWGSISDIEADTPNRVLVAHTGDRNDKGEERKGISNFIAAANREGTITEVWTQYDDLLQFPHAIEISPYDPERAIWVVERAQHALFKFSNDGKKVLMRLGDKDVPKNMEEARANPKPGPFHYGQPAVMAFLPDGGFILGDGYWNCRVVRYDKDGKYISEFGSCGKADGQFDTVHGLSVGKDGRIYVADRTNSRVQVFSLDGKHIATWPNIVSPAGMFSDENDSVWVLDRVLNRILKYNRDGELQTYFGAYGFQAGGYPGGLARPHGWDVDSEGTLYIANYDQNFDGYRPSKWVPKPGADPKRLIGKDLVLPRSTN